MDTQKTPPGAAAIDILLQTTPAAVNGKQAATPAPEPKPKKQPSAPTPVWRGPWWH